MTGWCDTDCQYAVKQLISYQVKDSLRVQYHLNRVQADVYARLETSPPPVNLVRTAHSHEAKDTSYPDITIKLIFRMPVRFSTSNILTDPITQADML